MEEKKSPGIMEPKEHMSIAYQIQKGKGGEAISNVWTPESDQWQWSMSVNN